MELTNNIGCMSKLQIETFAAMVLKVCGYIQHQMKWTTAGNILIDKIVYMDESNIGTYPYLAKYWILHEIAHIDTHPQDYRHGEIFHARLAELIKQFMTTKVLKPTEGLREGDIVRIISSGRALHSIQQDAAVFTLTKTDSDMTKQILSLLEGRIQEAKNELTFELGAVAREETAKVVKEAVKKAEHIRDLRWMRKLIGAGIPVMDDPDDVPDNLYLRIELDLAKKEERERIAKWGSGLCEKHDHGEAVVTRRRCWECWQSLEKGK